MPCGNPHASEIPDVFDNLSSRNGAKAEVKDQEVAKMMNAFWANFGKTMIRMAKACLIGHLEKDELLEFRNDRLAMGLAIPEENGWMLWRRSQKNRK